MSFYIYYLESYIWNSCLVVWTMDVSSFLPRKKEIASFRWANISVIQENQLVLGMPGSRMNKYHVWLRKSSILAAFFSLRHKCSEWNYFCSICGECGCYGILENVLFVVFWGCSVVFEWLSNIWRIFYPESSRSQDRARSAVPASLADLGSPRCRAPSSPGSGLHTCVERWSEPGLFASGDLQSKVTWQ